MGPKNIFQVNLYLTIVHCISSIVVHLPQKYSISRMPIIISLYTTPDNCWYEVTKNDRLSCFHVFSYDSSECFIKLLFTIITNTLKSVLYK